MTINPPTDRGAEPLPAPRDIEGNTESTFVKCPDCLGAVFNLRHQRQGHLKWHDELDAAIIAALDAASGARQAAAAAERQLGEARREITELRRELGETSGPAGPAVALVGDWPEDELAEHEAARAAAATSPAIDPDAPGETSEAETADVPAPTAADVPDDDYVEIPARRF